MEFENDVFVSYAHIDDQTLSEGQKGWITAFHRALEVRLSQLLGKTPRIFRDPKLQGNDFFADRLVDRLPRVASLVSVLSPRYVNSDWCRRELREFLKASEATGGLRVADKSRVFKVVKTPIPLDQHPRELKDVLGYDFFFVEPETGRSRELSQLADPEAQRRYWARLDDLAHDIAELLRILHARAAEPGNGAAAGDPAGTRAEPAAGAPSPRGAIYLAEASSDQRDKRDAIRRELLGQGFDVLPDRPLPLVGSECAAFVREQLGRCRMSIHLVGRSYGIVPEGARESIVVMQSELAVERGTAGGFSRLIWLPPGLETDDDRQRHFIEGLQTDSRLEKGADLLETPLEEFTTALHRRLAPESPRPEEPVPGAGDGDVGGGPCRVYLICDQRDLDSTPPLEDHLFAQGFEVVVPVFAGEESEVRRDHEENLVLCDAALVYYGGAGELWLRQKLREMQKSAGYGRKRPFRARAIYLAPPDTAEKRRLRTHEAMVLREGAGFDPAALELFVRQLQPVGALGA